MEQRTALRRTTQRQVILEELQLTKSHPTADEIYDRVRKRIPRISLGTVYRNLEALAARGMIRKLVMGGSQKRFDVNTKPHCHVRCLECGMLRDVSLDALPALTEMVKDWDGFHISGVSLEFSGLCPDCQRGSETASHMKYDTFPT
jgi:Fur family ferric uptake transcriptional regulator